MYSMDSDQEIISTHNLNKKFGGIVVAKNVNFSVNKGELRCLIGPNGAGKSTLFSLLCGIEKADSGQITILNKNVTKLKSFQRIKLGLGLKFQTNRAFQNLSIRDNLSISNNKINISNNEIAEERYKLALSEFKLESEGAKLAGELPHNMLQWLEITMILASFPKIVLLDEPTAGMSVEETLFTGSVLKRLNATGLTIIVVEHDIQFVKDVANKITVLHEGEIFSEGTAEEVSNSEEVKKGIFPVKPLKPTGAGDAFMGSLIGALLKNYDLQKAIEIGSAAAAIVVTKVGCAPAMPDLDEVLNFMKSNNINKGDK